MTLPLCPCGSEVAYAACCGACYSGTPAPTALALMRSRYTAYVEKNFDYIIGSTDPDNVSSQDRAATVAWANEAEWTGLTIVATEKGAPADDEGVVEFVARFVSKGQPQEHRECSRFRKIDGRWFYVDGRPSKGVTVRSVGPKPERNAACPCGSGKKYKRCHGA